MIKTDHIISKSILASIALSIGCILCLLSHNYVVGSILLSLSLYSIIAIDCNLFTTKSGFLSKSVDFRRLSLILLLNLLFITAIGLVAGLLCAEVSSASLNVASSKLNNHFSELVIKSIVTGSVMTFAVSSSVRHPDHYLLPILSIFGITITDCHHCVTDMFYYGASGLLYENFPAAVYTLLLIITFNFIGCNLYNLFINKSFIYNNDN